mgnify:CR=1 FL=1
MNAKNLENKIKNNMPKIYSTRGNGGCGEQPDACCESPSRDMEAQFIHALVEIICETLAINWNDRRIVEALLKSNLKDKLNNRYKEEGLLQQYAASQLDEAAARFYSDLKIPKEIKVNHDYAPHAKYADIVDWIKKNYAEKSKSQEKTEVL